MNRVRLVGALVQLELVVDDGDILTPLRVEPLRLAPAELAEWSAETAIADAQRQIDALDDA